LVIVFLRDHCHWEFEYAVEQGKQKKKSSAPSFLCVTLLTLSTPSQQHPASFEYAHPHAPN
jgi:hypothetical protein